MLQKQRLHFSLSCNNEGGAKNDTFESKTTSKSQPT